MHLCADLYFNQIENGWIGTRHYSSISFTVLHNFKTCTNNTININIMIIKNEYLIYNIDLSILTNIKL